MAHKLKYIIFIFAILTTYSSEAQTNFSLNDCINYGLNHSIKLANANLDIEQSNAKVKEYLSSGLPQLNADGSYQYFINIPTQFLPNFIEPAVYGVLFKEGLIMPRNLDQGGSLPVQFGTKHNMQAGLKLSQLLFSGAYFVGLEAAKTLQDLTKKQIRRNQREIRKDITKAYFTALLLQENKKILEKNIGLLEKGKFEAEQFYKNGFIEQLDIDKLQLSLNSLITQLDNLQLQYSMAVDVLKFQMNMDINEKIQLTDNLEQYLLSNDTIIENSIKRCEVDELETQKKLVLLNVKRYKMSRYPTVVAFASGSANRQTNDFDFLNFKNRWYPTTLIGLNVSVPIWDSGTRKHQQKQAEIDALKIENALTMVNQAQALEKAKALSDIKVSQNSINSAEAQIALAEKIYNKTKIKYKEGVGSSIEVTQAEAKLFESQAMLVNAWYQYLMARTDLMLANGMFE